jgi:Flp pilus assembly protein TadG
MRQMIFRKHERGTSMAEFALVASFFFMLIFAVIELGRLLYTHNALTDAARRGARYAVIHTAEGLTNGAPQDTTCVKNVIIYGETHINSSCAPLAGAQPLINGITNATIRVSYNGADLDGNPGSPNPYGANLGTATVTITGYQFNLSIPFLRRALTLPAYTTTLPAESAGFEPSPLP